MAEIKCPKCGEVIKLDKSSYDALLNEVEKEELEKRVKLYTSQLEETYKAKLELEKSKLANSSNVTLSDLKGQIKVLEEKLSSKDKENEVNLQKIKDQYSFELKAKDEEIQRYKDFRMGDSTKDLGESLEKFCSDAFDEIRPVAYPNAYFEKDNDAGDGSKGDFIFRDFSDDNIELVSIMFEMKNQKDDTEHKHKNSDFFKKLDQDRAKKNCEYAVLVSTLEEDSKLYNSGIVDVSHRYPKMFVVRPQFFLTIIGLIRNIAKDAYNYKKAVVEYKQQNADITHFEEAVKAVMDKVSADYEKANNIYSQVDKMCDDIVKKVENFRKDFHTATGWMSAANNQLPNLEVRKLTKNNPTMKEKFDELKKNESKDN